MIGKKRLKACSKKDDYITKTLRFVGIICFLNSKHKVEFSICAFIRGAILVGTAIPFGFYGITKLQNLPSITSLVVTISHFGSLVIASILSILMAGIRYKSLAKMYSLIDSVKTTILIDDFNDTVDFIFGASFFFNLIFFLSDSIIFTRHNNAYIWRIPSYVNELMLFFQVAQASLVAIQIKKLFLSLNSEISKTLEKTRRQCFIELDLALMEMASISSFSTAKPTFKTQSLQNLCDTHWVLCQAINEFNKALGVQLLCLMFTVLVGLVDSPYYIFLAATRKEYANYDILLITNVSLRFLMHAGHICAITIPCGQATSAAKETASTISKHIRCDASDETKNEAKTFSVLLQQHSVTFSVLGIFNLQESVVTRVTAAVATYLIIILQFQSQE